MWRPKCAAGGDTTATRIAFLCPPPRARAAGAGDVFWTPKRAIPGLAWHPRRGTTAAARSAPRPATCRRRRRHSHQGSPPSPTIVILVRPPNRTRARAVWKRFESSPLRLKSTPFRISSTPFPLARSGGDSKSLVLGLVSQSVCNHLLQVRVAQEGGDPLMPSVKRYPI